MVFEVNLTTVKVRNWDKTISTVPPYTLVSEAFVNWRGMFESGGRRVKRHLNIDMSSVKFLTDKELKTYKADNLVSDADNPEELTNFTMFRRYMLRYLQNNPRVNSEMTLLVRHLQPSEHGIPIEFYFFSADTAWAAYETLQADVFDFAIAKAHEFGLKIFQNISGCLNSLKNLS
jgi:miniconductance mechanosensitive channel